MVISNGFMKKTAVLMRELLSENGKVYVHLDWHVEHYVKTILDEVFSTERMVNEIIWYYDEQTWNWGRCI